MIERVGAVRGRVDLLRLKLTGGVVGGHDTDAAQRRPGPAPLYTWPLIVAAGCMLTFTPVVGWPMVMWTVPGNVWLRSLRGPQS